MIIKSCLASRPVLLSGRFSQLLKQKVVKKIENEQLQKLIFDEQNKSLIYKHQYGEESLRWFVRGTTLLTVLDTFLYVSELTTPVFGGWNGFSFGVCSALGIGMLVGLNIFSKRIVSEMKLYKQGDFVEIKYFNAFWTQQRQTVHCSEFAVLEPSYFGYHKVELTSIGKIWLNLSRNCSISPELGYDVVTDILSGNPVKLDAQKRKKYQKS